MVSSVLSRHKRRAHFRRLRPKIAISEGPMARAVVGSPAPISNNDAAPNAACSV